MESPDQLISLMLNKQQNDDMWFETSVIAAKRVAIQKLMKEYCDEWILKGVDKKRESEKEKRRGSESDDDVIIIEG
jgi:hypothetical protein